MATFSYTSQPSQTGNAIVGEVVGSVAHSYNDSSAVYVLSGNELNYGSIVNTVNLSEDYGNITDQIYTSQQVDDFGVITLSETIVPYGSIFVGNAVDYKFIKINIGEVSFTIFGEAALFVTPREFGTGSVGIKGDSYVTVHLKYFGSGSLFDFNSSSEATLYNPPDDTLLFSITGSGTEKNTESYVGYGSLFSFGSGSQVLFFNAPPGENLFRFSGAAVERVIIAHNGSGKVVNDIQIDEKITYSYNESSRIEIINHDYGFISEAYLDSDDYGTITDNEFLGREVEDYGFIVPDRTIIPYGSIVISSFALTPRTTINYGGGKFEIGGEAKVFTTPIEVGSGAVSIKGSSGDPIIGLSHRGSGSLFSFGSSTESTFKSAQTEGTLYEFTGTAIESFSKGTYFGSGSLFAFTSTAESSVVSPDVSALFSISGDAYVVATLSYVGSGSIFTFVSATESEVFNPPEEGTLFRLSGFGESSFISGGNIGSGVLFAIGGGSDSETYAEQQISGVFGFSGSAVVSDSNSYVGDGFLRTKIVEIIPATIYEYADVQISVIENRQISELVSVITVPNGATESVGFNPPEEGTLFRISDKSDEKALYSYHASGTFRFSDDAAYTIFKIGHIGSGEFDINGVATESVSPAPHIGSGSLFTFVSATEAVVANPPEDTALFKFSGSAVETATDSYVGSINIDLEGSAIPIFRVKHIGSGSLFTFRGGTEAFVVSPDDTKVLFTVSGNAIEKQTDVHVGSGSLFTFISKTESTVVSPDDTKVLFTITGNAVEKNTESYRGSGSLFSFTGGTESYTVSPDDTKVLFSISGESKNRILANNVGSGSLFAFTGSTEARAVSPDDTKVLFTISGNAVEKNTDSYVGQGSLFSFTGGTESVGFSPDDTRELFKIGGEGSGRYLLNNIGRGSLFAFSSTTEATVVNPPEDTALFIFVGNSEEKRTKTYIGQGSLFSFTGGTESVGFSPDDTKVLFEFTGNATESIVPAPHIGSGTLFSFINGTESITVFAPTEPVIFRFVGNGVESQATSYAGSGRLFAISGSTDSITIVYGITRVLFTVFGNGFESFIRANYDGFAESQITGQSQDRKINYARPQPTRLIII